MLPETAAERKLPPLASTFRAQAFLKQFWIIKALVNVLFFSASHTAEVAALVDFEGIESTLDIRDDDLIAPFVRWIEHVFVFSTPALKAHAVNLPPRYVHDTSRQEERTDVVTLNIHR